MKSLSREEGQQLLDGIKTNLNENLSVFLLGPDAQIILSNALRAANLSKRVAIVDFTNSILLWSISNRWFDHIEKPETIYAFFKTTIRRLITKRSFLKQYMGIDPYLDYQTDSLEAKDDGRKSWDERLTDEETDQSVDIAIQKVSRFQEIVCIVAEKYPKFGELLERYYLKGESPKEIAITFLRKRFIVPKGKESGDSFSEDQIQAATLNIQNSLLPRARDKFNEAALSKKYDFHLEGKIKKSIIRNINN